MEIILTKDVENLGAKNEVVRVKDGYGRNYLLPRNLAIPATAGNLKARGEKIKQAAKEREGRVSEAQKLAQKLNGKTFIILAKAGKEGKLFGSVTTQDVVGAIFHLAGIEVDKRKVNLVSAIKNLGLYQVNIKLEQGVTAAVRIDVRPDVTEDETPEAEAEAPAGPAEGEGHHESSAGA